MSREVSKCPRNSREINDFEVREGVVFSHWRKEDNDSALQT